MEIDLSSEAETNYLKSGENSTQLTHLECTFNYLITLDSFSDQIVIVES
jgi:hypothetical protein